MAMGKGAKIAIGCVVAFIVAVVAVSAILFGAAWWGVGKARQAAQQMAGQQERIEKLKKEANANPFTAPAGGIIKEGRLVKFLNVRKKVFGVYEAHKAELEATQKSLDGGKSPGLDGLKALGQVASIVNEIRLVQAEALAAEGMSEPEYHWFVGTIYTSMVGTEIAKHTGGKSVSEATGEAADAAAEQAERTARDAEQSGQPPEIVKALRESAEKARESARTWREEAQKADVPRENVELLTKYENDIKKYAMGGLEMFGL